MDDLDVYMVPSTGTLLDAIDMIERNRSRCVFVVEGEKNRVVGAMSEGDVMRLLLKGTSLYAPLQDVANPSFKFLREHDVAAALDLFRRYFITALPVVDDAFNLIHVIALREMIDYLQQGQK